MNCGPHRDRAEPRDDASEPLTVPDAAPRQLAVRCWSAWSRRLELEIPDENAVVSLPALRRGIGSSTYDGGNRNSYVRSTHDDEMRSGSG